ncbi:MAG: hypothetical protein HOV79_15970 [Hamadaea sp.]|nr:hypothetical protein [Hamadaea sp.]
MTSPPPPYGAPPPGYPQPYGAPPPPPAKKGFFTLPKVLLIVGLVLVLCCGGVAFAGYKLFVTVSDAVAPARDTADAFLTDLEQGDTAGAYTLLCSTMTSAMTEAEFDAESRRLGRIVGHEIDGVSVNTTNGVTTGAVTVTLRREGRDDRQTVIALRKESGDWKVCGSPF